MVSFDRESLLLDPVAKYARRQNFAWQDSEVPFYEYRIDFFAYSKKLELTVAVELKLSRWRRALQQAILYQLCADRVFIALPQSIVRRVDLDLLEAHGVGLISVAESGRCQRVLCSQQSTVVLAQYRQAYIEMLKKVA